MACFFEFYGKGVFSITFAVFLSANNNVMENTLTLLILKFNLLVIMTIMKVFLASLLLLSATNLFAADAVDIYLKGGKVVSGYFKVKNMKDKSKVFKYSTTEGGPTQSMELADIDSVVVKADTAVIVPLKWIEHSDVALNKEQEKGLFLRIYRGKNIDGYVTLSDALKWTSYHRGALPGVTQNSKYLYQVRGEEFAHAYYKVQMGDYDSNVRLIIKKGAKKAYPKLYEYVQTDEFKQKTKGISKHPEMVLPLFDEVFGSK